MDILRPKEVVAVLPYIGNRVLLQLRDFKEGIVFPGHWGLFSGSMEEGESPQEAMRRELYEELMLKPKQLEFLSTDIIADQGNTVVHSFYCPLRSLHEVELCEGTDLGLFSLEEIQSSRLYSQRLKKRFPVIPSPYLPSIVQKFLETMRTADPNNL